MDGVSHTWDANGNASINSAHRLLDDGTNTYTYDPANRISTVSGSLSASYAYNGLGNRLEQTVGISTTTYILDLNAGLTQILDDGTNTYLYGNGRIAQVNTTTQYFLGDALGSVRQMTNPDSAVVLAKAYDPYGVDILDNGAASTSYGFTGEQTDPTGIVYLRARYYTPNAGRFMSRDTWNGNQNQPISYNKWAYTYDNPINLSDPTGMRPGDDRYCVPLTGEDQLHCNRIVRSLNPLGSMTMEQMHVFDIVEQYCYPLPPLYEVLNIPGNTGDKYQSYGFWFHYLRNEKSKRSGGEPVSISTVISYALSGELNVSSLYSSIMPHMVKAMAAKSQWLGTYFVLGSRIMDEVDPYIFLDDGWTTRIKERNLATGNISGEDMLQEYSRLGPAYDQLQPGLLAEVEKNLRINFGTDFNNIPTDWGNTTEYTRGLPIYAKLRANPNTYDPTKVSTDPMEVYWRSDPNMNDLGQFFIVTTNQIHNLCPGGFSCIAP